MAEYTVIDAHGTPLRWGGCPADEVDGQAGPGELVIDGLPPSPEHIRVEGAWVERPPRPAIPGAWWDSAARAWIDPRDLDARKSDRIAALRLSREATLHGGFTWNSLTFDSDPTSLQRLLGLALAAQQPGFAPVDWRLADNTWRTLSATDALGVWFALTEHTRTHFGRFAELESRVLAATTADEVDAVVWTED